MLIGSLSIFFKSRTLNFYPILLILPTGSTNVEVEHLCIALYPLVMLSTEEKGPDSRVMNILDTEISKVKDKFR